MTSRSGRSRNRDSDPLPRRPSSASARTRESPRVKKASSAPEKQAERPRAARRARTTVITPAPAVDWEDDFGRRYFGLRPCTTQLNQLFDDVAGTATVGFRLEVRHDAVPEHRGRDRTYIIIRRNGASRKRGPRLRTQDQVLRGSRTGAPTHILACQRRRFRVLRTRRTPQTDRIPDQRRRCRNPAAQTLELD